MSKSPNRLRIVSDGTLGGTQFLDSHGNNLDGLGAVLGFTVHASWNEDRPPIAHLDIADTELDIICEPELYATHNGKRYRLVECDE